MATSEGDVWHLVEARREDGSPTIFRIRDLAPRLEQPRIFVVELPYSTSELSRLPDATAYRRLGKFEEQWLAPACTKLGWTFVAVKIEAGSYLVYLYGGGEPLPLIELLSPFDGGLGFFDELDPEWAEYAALRELLDQALAIPDISDGSEDADGTDAALDAEVIKPKPAEELTRPSPTMKQTQTIRPVPSSRKAAKPPATQATKQLAKRKAPAKQALTKQAPAKRAPAKRAGAKPKPRSR